jgi:hypothetical protein
MQYVMSLYKLESVEPGVSSEIACFSASSSSRIGISISHHLPMCVRFKVLERIKLVQQTSAVHQTHICLKSHASLLASTHSSHRR